MAVNSFHKNFTYSTAVGVVNFLLGRRRFAACPPFFLHKGASYDPVISIHIPPWKLPIFREGMYHTKVVQFSSTYLHPPWKLHIFRERIYHTKVVQFQYLIKVFFFTLNKAGVMPAAGPTFSISDTDV